MEIIIEKAKIDQKLVLRNLLELYNYDFSEFDSADVDLHGLYGYNYLDNYWTEEGRHPYLFKVDGNYAGFALIRTLDKTSEESCIYSMAEFFIMKKYRNKGLGKSAAFAIFKLHPGQWRVAQIKENLPAQKFWRGIISEYTDGNFEEINEAGWDGPIQRFISLNRESDLKE